MNQPCFLGVDLGTSLLKLQVIDAAGGLIAAASAPLALSVPRPTWAEQDPAAWWAAFLAACRDLFATAPIDPRQIAAIGLSGQMHGGVFLDKAGEPLRPALIWADARTTAQVAQIEQLIPRAELIAITGNAPNTSFTATKILWVKQNEPTVYERAAQILLPKDYLRWRLTGVYATDVSDALGHPAFRPGPARLVGQAAGLLCYQRRSITARVRVHPNNGSDHPGGSGGNRPDRRYAGCRGRRRRRVWRVRQRYAWRPCEQRNSPDLHRHFGPDFHGHRPTADRPARTHPCVMSR